MSQRGPFSVPLTPAAVTTATDIFHITVAAENPVTLAMITLYQTNLLGDAAERILSMALVRGVTGGTGGTALTEVNYGDGGGSAPTAAVLGINTTASTVGTVLEHIGWNVRVDKLWLPPPEIRPSVDATQDPIVLRLLTAPAVSTTIGGTVWWFEG